MAMEFEYGCQTANKYMFFEQNEVEDPSELLAQVSKKEEVKSKAQAGKAVAKTETKGKPTSAKDSKKPLQQQTENKQAGRGHQKGGQKPASAGQGPREDKENTSNRSQNERRPQGDRRQRQEGEGGENRPRMERRGPRPEGDRPPRQEGDRPPRQEGDRPPRQERDRPPRQEGDRPPRQEGERPPRRFPRVPPAAGPEGEVQQGAEEEGKQGRRGPGASGRSGFRFRRVNDTHNRDFDRHSGSDRTGVKAVDKKEGAGKANWGTPQDELAGNEEAEQAVEETRAEETGDWAARVDESEEKKEEEPKEESSILTFAEYKALKQEVTKRNEGFNIRKPGEGEDVTKWGKSYVLKKKVDDEEEGEEEEEEEDEVDEEEDKRKQLLNRIQIKFNEPATSRGGQRGGRGGFRDVRPEGEANLSAEQSPKKRGPSGRGQRGGRPQGRGNNQPKTTVPKIEDEQDFPSLGK